MPDSNDITLKDIYEKQIILETLLHEVLKKLPLEDAGIMKGDDVNPFINPDTGLNDSNYYRSEHPKEKGK
jgi:fructose-bisphosphate aldolase class 1